MLPRSCSLKKQVKTTYRSIFYEEYLHIYQIKHGDFHIN